MVKHARSVLLDYATGLVSGKYTSSWHVPPEQLTIAFPIINQLTFSELDKIGVILAPQGNLAPTKQTPSVHTHTIILDKEDTEILRKYLDAYEQYLRGKAKGAC